MSNEINEAFCAYTSHDEDGYAEIVVPDEVLAGDVAWDDDEEL